MESRPTSPDARDEHAAMLRWTWGFVAVGVALRLGRFLLRYPLWHDEAFIAANLIDRSFAELAGPLDYLQVSPLLFLWLERAVLLLLGYGEWSLRLVPTLCSIAGLVLAVPLARRLIPGWPAAFAVAILAVSYSPIRHGNEVKSYAPDLLAAVVYLLIASRWLAGLRGPRPLWLLCILSPPLLTLSLPAVFVAGGVGLALFGHVARSGRRGVRLAFAGYAAVVAATFLAQLWLHLGDERHEELRSKYLRPYWSESFPPIEDGALPVAGWLARIHAGNLMAYPVGGEDGASILTLACVAIGLGTLLRAGRPTAAALLVLPFALNLAAAAIGRYPYGGEARIAQHLAPSACLLAGLGLAVAARKLRERATTARAARRPVRVAMIVLLAVGAGLFVESLARPYHMVSAEMDRRFARWFWAEQSRAGGAVNLPVALQRTFEPWQWTTGISADYLCNAAIYGPPPAPEGAGAADLPGGFVVFQVESYPPPLRNPAFLHWLAESGVDPADFDIETYAVNARPDLPRWKRSRYWVFSPSEARAANSSSVGRAQMSSYGATR